MNSLVSICIPTYKQVVLLKENLESICTQSYQNIEVIISDDTPNNTVYELVSTYRDRLPIQYIHNQPALGSPANWNSVLKKARGEFVLLFHHDDQFADSESLKTFLRIIQKNDSIDFVFGRNRGVNRVIGTKPFPSNFFDRYYQEPELLVLANMMGVPSNIFLRKEALLFYDERYKWIVDIEYYTRLIKVGKRFVYLDKELVITGIHEGQITNECIDDTVVVLYENISYAIDHIPEIKSIRIFDFYWRLLRNNNARTLEDLVTTGLKSEVIPSFIKHMLYLQSKLPLRTLRNGFLSKALMFYCYFKYSRTTK